MLALAPMRVAPAATIFWASSKVRMPPAAFTPMVGPTTRRINATSSTVAPPGPKPVEVLTKSAPATFASWQAMTWELYLDGQQIDLNAFGTYDDDLPQTGLPGHPPDEEVITKLRSWDVVLGNPNAGPHTLRFECRGKADHSTGYHLGVDSFAAVVPVYERPPGFDLRKIQK